MRYWDSYGNDDNEPTTGIIKVLSNIGSTYSDIWSKITDPIETNPVGGTPLAASLAEAKTYFLRDVNPVDTAIACRQKFIILITDGADTFGCSGNGEDPNCGDESSNPGMYRRRMQTVQRAKELAEAGIKVFVVGFGGGMPECLKRTLNWAAFYGQTDNPMDPNSGDIKAYNITTYGDPCTTTNTNADPAIYPLSGYAFLAEDASALTKAIKAIVQFIKEKSYSFTTPSVPSVRMIEKDILYISSFTPSENSFWPGSLKAYQLNADGTLPVDVKGFPLQAPIWVASIPGSGSRVIKTYVGGGLKDFTSANLAPADLAVADNGQRDALVSYIRNLPLGDIFHSNSVIVGPPTQFFEDVGFSGTGGFYENNKDRTKVIIVGANDGMLHAFDGTTGVEQWAFIPNSLLKSLETMQTSHTFYVDSTPKVADVWFDDNGDNKKTADEWRTGLVCGLRKGGKTYFALDITDTLNPKYLWEFPHPGDPKITDYNDFLNNILGQSWSEPVIGKVKIEKAGNLVERWVAFIGGGFDPSEKVDKDATIGKAFFVIDIKTGEIIWQFSYDNKDAVKMWMTHALPASPTTVDTNLDGYVDKVYVGDLGGQMWVFDVSFNELTKKSDSLWAGKRLFNAPGSKTEKHNIYYQPTVAFDKNGIPWVYFGTGDRENPNDKNSQERFYAVKDDGKGSYPLEEKDLSDITGADKNNFDQVSAPGWYIQLAKGDKVLAKPAVFNRLVYFTTYTYTESADLCAVGGVSKDYIVEYLSGGGALNVDDMSDILNPPSDFVYKRSQEIGSGAPSAPVITVNMKGKASVIIGTTSGQISSGEAFSPTTNREILYWREVVP